jgi:hypothetical protein
MNDFPIPEDPPVMTAAEKFLRAASGVGIGVDILFHHGRTRMRLRGA